MQGPAPSAVIHGSRPGPGARPVSGSGRRRQRVGPVRGRPGREGTHRSGAFWGTLWGHCSRQARTRPRGVWVQLMPPQSPHTKSWCSLSAAPTAQRCWPDAPLVYRGAPAHLSISSSEKSRGRVTTLSPMAKVAAGAPACCEGTRARGALLCVPFGAGADPPERFMLYDGEVLLLRVASEG